MRSRGLVVVLALVLATIAVAGLFLYTRSVRENALTSGGVSEVVVSKVNIPANSDLNQYINEGKFELKNIPSDDVVGGAITEIADLRNRRDSRHPRRLRGADGLPGGSGRGLRRLRRRRQPHRLRDVRRRPRLGAHEEAAEGLRQADVAELRDDHRKPCGPGRRRDDHGDRGAGPASPGAPGVGPTGAGRGVGFGDYADRQRHRGAWAHARGRAEVRVRGRSRDGVPVAASPELQGEGAPADDRAGRDRQPEGVDGQVSSQVIAVGTPQSFRSTLARALEVEPEDVGWVQSATAAEEVLVETDEPVDVLVVSPEVKEPDALGLAEFVGRTAPMTAIVMVRDRAWNGLLPAAMRAGIRDVVDITQGSEELRDAVERALAWADNLRSLRGTMAEKPASRGMVISVFSSKGGTGKTFITTNLATAIAELAGQDTAVVDLDVDMGDVYSYFGLEPTKQVMDLIGLGEGADPDTIFASSTKLGEHLYGFGAVPDPAMLPPAGEQVGKYLRTLRNTFPYVVVDASADYTDLALACFDLSDTICLVTGLDVVGVKHLSKALETLLTIGLPL